MAFCWKLPRVGHRSVSVTQWYSLTLDFSLSLFPDFFAVLGGNHFRAWKQNGTLADSGAWFLAVSKEVDVRGGHKIDEDGYNAGRNELVATAVQNGGTRFRKRSWTTTVEWIEGLLEPGKEGINHGISQDGRVAVLTAIEY